MLRLVSSDMCTIVTDFRRQVSQQLCDEEQPVIELAYNKIIFRSFLPNSRIRGKPAEED